MNVAFVQRTTRVWWRPLLVSFTLFLVAACAPLSTHAATTTVIYQSDFSTDPGWTTDQPENFFWDPTSEALFARTLNRPEPDYYPSRYFYTETTLDPTRSYRLTFDIFIQSVSPLGNNSGVATFGLLGDRLHTFNKLRFNVVGNEQDGSFSTRLMTLDGSSRFVFYHVNPGFNLDVSEVSQTTPFSFGTWYTVSEEFSAPHSTYTFEIRERESGTRIGGRTILVDPTERISPTLTNLGLSMYPEGEGGTNLELSSRIDGFMEYRIDNVELIQIYEETYTEPTSVLFLPGIQSSRLYTDGVLGTENQLWEPNRNRDVELLSMTNNGQSIEEVYTRDVIDEVPGLGDVYGDFVTFLEGLRTAGTISDFHAYAYDWRYAVDDVVESGTQYETEVRNLVAITKDMALRNNSPITIVAHSNGGLLAKALSDALVESGDQAILERIIFVAVPQLGTPKAVGSLLHGYEQSLLWGFILSESTAREAIRNMPGAYGLLLSEAYFSRLGATGLISFEQGTGTQALVDAYGDAISDYPEFVSFLTGAEGREVPQTIAEAARLNEAILASSTALHRDQLDSWRAPFGVEVVEFVGTGLMTVNGFTYKPFEGQFCINGLACVTKYYYEPTPNFTKYGDGTVVSGSAEAYQNEKRTFYVDLFEVREDPSTINRSHANVMALGSVQQSIEQIIGSSSISAPFIYTARPGYTGSTDIIGGHSPIDLSLVDSQGRRVETVLTSSTTKDVLTEIPGSDYVSLGGATYLLVPSDSDYIVTIRGKEVGSYTLTIDTVTPEGLTTPVSRFGPATSTPELVATFSKAGGSYGPIAIDYDGDGAIDEEVTVDGAPSVGALFDALSDLFSLFLILKDNERSWLVRAAERAERAGERKGYGSANVTRILDQIDGRLMQYVGEGTVSEAEYNEAKVLMAQITTR